ncbi:hypothetical protein [Bacillus taeanensis]|uniref:TlpA family protein disulfide reductase n=1 Tax=Bacillus taeanensis TaxID=273032 RepID=UPI003CCC4E5E
MGFFYALYSIFGKFTLKKYDSLTVTVYTFIFAAAAITPFSRLWAVGPLFLIDENSSTRSIYRVVTIPTTYMVDSNGVIQEKIVGPMNKEMMKKLVSSINKRITAISSYKWNAPLYYIQNRY